MIVPMSVIRLGRQGVDQSFALMGMRPGGHTKHGEMGAGEEPADRTSDITSRRHVLDSTSAADRATPLS